MSFVKRVHHVELLAKNLGSVCEYFSEKLGFQLFAVVKDGIVHRAALKNGQSIFVVRNSDYYRDENKCLSNNVDTVYDIALEVTDLNRCVHAVSAAGGQIVTQPTTLSDYNGRLSLAVVRSCFGNVIHTLIDSSQYKGLFMPGFTSPDPILSCKNRSHLQKTMFQSTSSVSVVPPFNNNSASANSSVQYIDHVTFALRRSQTQQVLQWYQKAFGMKRCSVNSQESDEDGFVVKHGNTGMKLKAFDYWRCAKESVQTPDGSFKFVLAEPLSDEAPNQITTFLKNHHGEGIQHIGLHVDNIIDTTREYRRRGAQFLIPPDAYYSESEKRQEITSLALNLKDLQDQGILVDTEPHTTSPHWHECKRKGYLLQVFSRPIFEQETFFLELIERRGATGFGAGNIKALWRAVDSYMNDQCKCPP